MEGHRNLVILEAHVSGALKYDTVDWRKPSPIDLCRTELVLGYISKERRLRAAVSALRPLGGVNEAIYNFLAGSSEASKERDKTPSATVDITKSTPQERVDLWNSLIVPLLGDSYKTSLEQELADNAK